MEDKVDSYELTGIMDYLSDEAAAETSPIDTDKADKYFTEGMEVLKKLNTKRQDETKELIEEYIMERRIVDNQAPYVPLTLEEMRKELAGPDLGDDQPPELEVSDDGESAHDSDEDTMEDEFESNSDCEESESDIIANSKDQVV